MIYVECKPDFILVNNLGASKKEIIHGGGKAEVCRKMMKTENCIGLVDEDPASIQPPYLRKLKIKTELSQHGIKILKDDKRNNYLIILCPKLEEWIIKATIEAKIDIRKYNLPNDPDKLHSIININIKKFEKLLVKLKEESNRMRILRSITVAHQINKFFKP